MNLALSSKHFSWRHKLKTMLSHVSVLDFRPPGPNKSHLSQVLQILTYKASALVIREHRQRIRMDWSEMGSRLAQKCLEGRSTGRACPHK